MAVPGERPSRLSLAGRGKPSRSQLPRHASSLFFQRRFRTLRLRSSGARQQGQMDHGWSRALDHDSDANAMDRMDQAKFMIAYEPCNTLSNTFQNPCELPRIYNSWCPVQTLFPSLYSLQIGGGRRPLLGWISSTLLPAPSSRLNVFVTSERLRRLRSSFCLQLPVRLNQQGPAHDGAAPLKG